MIDYRQMRQLRSASASPTMWGHSKLDLATLDIVALLTWRTVSPSAMLMVDPRNGARAVIRDTGSAGGRYLWSILAAGDMQPISEGRTDDLARAQSIAKAALRAYGEKRLRSSSIRM